MNKILYSFLLIATLFFENKLLYSQSVALDDSFGNAGIVITPTPNSSAIADLIIQPDNKIIAVGHSNYLGDYHIQLARYNSDGSIDDSFGVNGLVNTDIGNNNLPYSSILQPDGKILVCGTYLTNSSPPFSYHSSLVRYNNDGTLDNSFGLNGVVKTIVGNTDGIFSLALNTDGKIVAGGYSDNQFLLLQYNIDGTLDTSFGTDGIVISSIDTHSSIWSMKIQPDGKIVAGGNSGYGLNTRATVVRYNTDGSLDNGFGANGVVITDLAEVAVHLRLYSDGKIIIAGYSGNKLALIKYNNNGQLDPTFASAGVFTSDSYPSPSSIEIQSDNKIIVCGNVVVSPYNYGYHIMRFNHDGTVDGTFGNSDTIILDIKEGNDYVQSVKIQSDNKILLGGSSRDSTTIPAQFTLVRFTSELTGISEQKPFGNQISVYPNPFNHSAVLETNMPMKNASVIWYNNLGQIVREQKNISGSLVILKKGELSEGTYTLSLVQDNKIMNVIKLMITK